MWGKVLIRESMYTEARRMREKLCQAAGKHFGRGHLASTRSECFQMVNLWVLFFF